jgi:hypothetical protein
MLKFNLFYHITSHYRLSSPHNLKVFFIDNLIKEKYNGIMSAKYGTFRINLLPGFAHSKETKEIWSGLKGSKSKFARDAILSLAKKFGFQEPNQKPEYLSDKQWQIYLNSREARRNIKNGSVDYNYYPAFHFLKSLPEYQDATFGKVARDAVRRH